MSPYSDPDEQQAYERSWIAGRREAWLSTRRCALCGAPATALRAAEGERLPKGIFSSTAERRDQLLAECGAETFCARCAPWRGPRHRSNAATHVPRPHGCPLCRSSFGSRERLEEHFSERHAADVEVDGRAA